MSLYLPYKKCDVPSVPCACHHMPPYVCIYLYINHLCSFCLPPYVRKRSLIKRTKRKVSCGKAPTSRDNLGHLSERLLYTFYTTIPLLIMVIVFVLFVLNTTQTNANKIQIKTLRRAELIRIICQRGLGLFFTTFTVHCSGTVVVCSDYMKKKKCLLCFCHKYIKYKRRSHLVSM